MHTTGVDGRRNRPTVCEATAAVWQEGHFDPAHAVSGDAKVGLGGRGHTSASLCDSGFDTAAKDSCATFDSALGYPIVVNSTRDTPDHSLSKPAYPHRLDGCEPILLTGATGYIGGRLLPALLEKDYKVRCLARRPEQLQAHAKGRFEVIAADMANAESLGPALAGVATAFYLIHSMGTEGRFAEQDRLAAMNFAQAARAVGLRRIIYLGGLGGDKNLSAHLASRQEVGQILRESGVPTIEFRASIIIGSGSLSFEMVRALVTRLPIMTTPKWVRSLAQPIAVEDVLAYCLAAVELPGENSVVYEIGGPDRVSYADLMREYGRQVGLHRLIIPVPVLSPGLSSLWLGLVTPLYARVGRKLIESVKHDTVVEDDRALRDFAIRPRGLREAIARALANEDRAYAQTRWSDALSSAGTTKSWGGVRFGRRLIDRRRIHVDVKPAAAFAPIERIGGQTGWYFANWLWKLRAAIDLIFGGVGMRRGRRNPWMLQVGDALDFWRVEAIEPPALLRLRAEMKLPGRAWLQFEVEPAENDHGSWITQTAMFDPVGLLGPLYWYMVWPLHQWVFAGMLRQIARATEQPTVASPESASRRS